MNCPKCGFPQPRGASECKKCGVIFSKIKPPASKKGASPSEPSWTDSLEVGEETPPIPARKEPKRPAQHGEKKEEPAEGYYRTLAYELLFREIGDIGPQIQYARGFLWMLLLFATVKIAFVPFNQLNDNGVINLFHLVNLPFHEAGHIFFTPFGRFMQVLGGSLTQILIPLACLGGFLLAWRDPFAGSVAWWWAGENLLDLAPYIGDARAGEILLIGGITGRENPDFHDWKNLLTWTGLLKYDHALAKLAVFMGTAMMVSALGWGGFIVWRGLRPKEP